MCAFRSFWPRIDLERTVLVDHPLSSMVLGRAAATVAEVGFAAQIALWLHVLGAQAGVGWLASAAPVVVPLLALAQVFCWSSVVTLSHLGHAIEESIWAVVFAGVAVGLAAAWPATTGVAAVYVTVGLVGASRTSRSW